MVKNHAGHGTEFRETDVESRERNGFMVKVWWVWLEQQVSLM